jgi:hypothetical protein
MNGDHARKSIQWDVYLAIAAAFGVSNAMQNTGVANEFAQVFISIGELLPGHVSHVMSPDRWLLSCHDAGAELCMGQVTWVPSCVFVWYQVPAPQPDLTAMLTLHICPQAARSAQRAQA